MNYLMYTLLGLIAGIASGFLGIGGAVIIIPALIFIWGLTQHQAQGTTLALMVLPIGLLAALKYYFEGHVNIPMAAFICIGFFIGGLIGATLVQPVPDPILKKIFGGFLLIVGARMIFA